MDRRLISEIAGKLQKSEWNRISSRLPEREAMIRILEKLHSLLFAGYIAKEEAKNQVTIKEKLLDVFVLLREQLEIAFSGDGDKAEASAIRLMHALPEVRSLLLCDVEAGYYGDPAAKSREDIIISYPGLYAIFVYRIAHLLYQEAVPLIPRMMTEYAHSMTGIDINAGATIGKYFFIDHGTGVVIGETTVIGDYVKLYQGVTLGALSTRSGQELSGVKRHPTIGNRVTIYANSTVLGGETVIGDGVIIGGNAFITRSVPENTKVSVKNPEMIFKNPTTPTGKWEI